MKHIFIVLLITSFYASSHASAPFQDAAKPVYNQSCFVNYSLSGFLKIEHITCSAVKAACEKIKKENKDPQTLAQFQICFKGPAGNSQCGMSQTNITCDQAVKLIEQAQASCKDE